MLSTLSHGIKQPINRITWLSKSLNSWSFAIKNASSSSPQRALKLYTQMQRQNIPFNSFVILFALKSSSHLHNLSLTRHLHAHLLKLGFASHVYVATSLLNAYVIVSFIDACSLFDEIPQRNTVTWNTMITGFLRCGDVKNGRKLFDEMPTKDLTSWATMTSGYINNGYSNEGLSLFRKMVINEGKELKPDEVILGTVLSGCAKISSGLILGKTVHSYAIKNNWKLNVEFGTCLVDMYTKCGYIKNACLVFDMMEHKNVVTWTALICGAAQHNYGKEALLIFDKMKESKVKPNELTFTGILNACAQTGMIKEGRIYFKMIKDEYNLRPTIQHYGCIIDLFGKAGLLSEAYEIINSMEFEPNVVIWGSFLSSCKLHKQFEMAEKVIDRVMKMISPENDGGVYTIIADIYVLNNKWQDAERMRTIMLNHNVKKARGSSFINTAL